MPITHKYDHIFSLGYNCEISFQLIRRYHFLESSLFSWTYLWSLDDTIDALEHLEDIGGSGFKHPDPLYECNNTHVRFHGRAGMRKILSGTFTKEEEEKDLEELSSRVAYLKEKFQRTATDGKHNLYVVKIRETENAAQIQKLYQALQKRVTNPFDLLVVSESTSHLERAARLDSETIFLRQVKCFTPEDKVANFKLADNVGWRHIFSEFSFSRTLWLKNMLTSPKFNPNIPFKALLIGLLHKMKAR